MYCNGAMCAHRHVSKQDTATLQRRQMIKWNMLMREESSQGCRAPPCRLDWTAPKAQSLVLTSWLSCLSHTREIIETAVSRSVNGTVVWLLFTQHEWEARASPVADSYVYFSATRVQVVWKFLSFFTDNESLIQSPSSGLTSIQSSAPCCPSLLVYEAD